MNYGLPESLEIGGGCYAIRWDYRAALDILEALSDPELNGEERSLAALTIHHQRWHGDSPLYRKIRR